MSTQLENGKKTAIDPDLLLTAREVVEIFGKFGLSKSRLYKLTASREIPHYKYGPRSVLFSEDEIREYVVNRLRRVEVVEDA